ncbi:MAG: FAD-dependent oxidoreductase [Gammaproteobacteria bacterium]|nr:FAD-dependent oxidoreductase [Gammaproteobacteria bacterium]
MTNHNKPKPVYVDRLPPCNAACPAGQNAQKWLRLVKIDKLREAWEVMMQENPLPATLGRVCYHPCENSCNRYGFDAAVNINAVERFVGDVALGENWSIDVSAESNGKKIMVVGAGPAGLSAAYHLTLKGYQVTVFDARDILGGMMHYGIPSFRLDRKVLDAEIKRIENMGVKFVLNHKVEDILKEKEEGGFDAVFLGLGATKERFANLALEGDKCQIMGATELLDAIEHNQTPDLSGKRVVVYGGGNTAIDAARASIRLQAKKVEIVYRRNREKMPAYDFEVREAAEEGVGLRLLRTISEISNNKITLDVMHLNHEGWPEPTGEHEAIEADVVIMALGLNVDTKVAEKVDGIKLHKDGSIIVDEHMVTGASGIFAGGDVVPYDRSVATAVGHGKKAAKYIDKMLSQDETPEPVKHELAGHDKLHTYYYEKQDRKVRSHIPFEHRKTSFDEVVVGLEEREAIHETERCFSCGNCFECDTCMNVCPVKAIHKVGPGKGYTIDYDVCIRCGLCVKKCPCGAMGLIEE